MDMHEYLSYSKKASSGEIVKKIQAYYGAWADSLYENGAFAEVKIDGKSACSTEGKQGFLDALKALSEAQSFSIEVSGRGLSEEEAGVLYPFLDELKEEEEITYKFMAFSSKYAEFKCGYIENGMSGSLLDNASSSIAQEEGMLWYSWGCDLNVDFDLDAYENVAERLHAAVRKHVPKDQIGSAEAEWNGENGEPGHLLPDIQWVVSDLKEINAFLDEINAVLSDLDGNYEIKADGLWFDLDHFAAAKWIVSDKKVKLVG